MVLEVLRGVQTINVPTPVIRVANSALRPSRRNESDRFSPGAHGTDTVKGPLVLTNQNV